MNPTHNAFFDALKAAGPTRADALARITMLTRLLDSAFLIPGLNRRVGFDAVSASSPVSAMRSRRLSPSYIIWEARQLGLPRWKIARMIGNVAVDTADRRDPVRRRRVRRLLQGERAQPAHHPQASRRQAGAAGDRRHRGAVGLTPRIVRRVVDGRAEPGHDAMVARASGRGSTQPSSPGLARGSTPTCGSR